MFPEISGVDWPRYVPEIVRLGFGPAFLTTGVIQTQPPDRGAPYVQLLPQIDSDGNEKGGVRLPHVAVPLATHTGWNRTVPSLREFGYLAGVNGSYMPFAFTKAEREASKDPRLSIQERYSSKQDFLSRIRQAAQDLVSRRFLLPEDVDFFVDGAQREWDWIAARKN